MSVLHIHRRRQIPAGIPGAIVIGGDYQGLGIVRSLGRRGVPVCVLDDESSISRYSRYTSMWIRVRDLRNEQSFMDALTEMGNVDELIGWVLFPTRDELVAAISRHREELSARFRVLTPEWGAIKWIWDKRNTYNLAKELDIPIAKTWVPTDQKSAEEIRPSFPVALKPSIKEHFFYATKAKAWQANTQSELAELFRRATEVAGSGEIIVQDVIPGDGRHQFAYGAFFKDGKAIGSMVSRRRRQHPHDFGRASTYVETIDMPALECLSERFLKAINYYGLVEMEYKLDPRDGQFKLLDVNARTWGYHTLGSSAGVDFPYLIYQDQLGKDVTPCRGRAGVSWVRLITDLPTGVADIFRSRLSASEYIRSVRNVHTEAVFSKEDPLPGIMECAMLPYLFLKRGF